MTNDEEYDKLAQTVYDSLRTVKEFFVNPVNPPAEYVLEQNFPNPLNLATVFGFSIARDERVSFKIYNTLGQEVATVVERLLAAGRHQMIWRPSELPNGLYFYRFQAGGSMQTSKLLLLR